MASSPASEYQGHPACWVKGMLCFRGGWFGALVVYIWVLIGKLGPMPGMALPQLPGETGCFFCDEEGFLQSSMEGLLTEAEVSELPRRPAVPLTCWEEMDVSTAKKEVGDLLVA